MPDLEAAITRIKKSRQTHVDWRNYWLNMPEHGDCRECATAAEVAGDLERQIRLVAEYDNVLAVLYEMKESRE